MGVASHCRRHLSRTTTEQPRSFWKATEEKCADSRPCSTADGMQRLGDTTPTIQRVDLCLPYTQPDIRRGHCVSRASPERLLSCCCCSYSPAASQQPWQRPVQRHHLRRHATSRQLLQPSSCAPDPPAEWICKREPRKSEMTCRIGRMPRPGGSSGQAHALRIPNCRSGFDSFT